MNAPVFRPLRTLAAVLSLAVGLAAAAPAAFAIDIQRVVSPGGIEAWLVTENTLPILSIAFAFTGGSTQDPPGKAGTASLMTSMLDEGAGDLDGPAFQAILDRDSIRIGFGSDRDSVSGSLRTLTANSEEAFRLMRLALTAPRFDSEPLERIRTQVVANMKRAEKSPDAQAGVAFSKALYGDHPYAQPAAGTPESVAAIGADDLRAFMKNTMTRGNIKISVVGAIDAKQLAPVLDQLFGALPAEPKLQPVPQATLGKGKRIDVAAPVPQASIRFANAGIPRKDPDYYAATVANYIFGGGSFASRLYREVREKRGYAYSVSTGLGNTAYSASMSGGTATRADRAEETLALIRDEMKRFITEGATEAELADAKAFLIGNYAIRFTDSNTIARQLLAIQQEDLGIDYINKRNGYFAAVTLADVNRAAKRIYDPDNMVVSVVGAQPAATPAAAPAPGEPAAAR
ncbi:MAG: pitrilysin family protein [Bauldia sp.]